MTHHGATEAITGATMRSSGLEPEFCLLGWGRTGVSVARFLRTQGRALCVWDDSSAQRDKAQQDGWPVGLPDMALWKGAIIVSPGIAWDYPVLSLARQEGVPILSDIQFFCHTFPGLTMIGVTGSNGKTTTCSLIKHGLESMGYQVVLAGNIGQPIFNAIPSLLETPVLSGGSGESANANASIDANTHKGINKNINAGLKVQSSTPAKAHPLYVLELSSYQLEYSCDLPLTAALVLNLVPHHLERHGTMERYAAIKRSILSRATHGWLPAYWPWSGAPEKSSQQECAQEPLVWTEDIVQSWELSPFLQTPHNRANTAAAMHVLSLFGTLPRDVWTQVTGMEHRQERVASYHGVTFVNDSKATNPHAAAAALTHWCARYDHVIWIAGGVLQHDDLSVLAPCIAGLRAVVLIGESAPRYAQWLASRAGPQCVMASSMENAVEQAVSLAHQWTAQTPVAEGSGDGNVCVVLSPGCASQDMFRDFEHRGSLFKEAVRRVCSSVSVKGEG